MSRLVLTFALFALAAAAQAVSPARHGPNGSATCPEAQAVAAVEGDGEARPAAAPDAAVAVPAEGAAVKPTVPARARSGGRWHSFLPGMFK